MGKRGRDNELQEYLNGLKERQDHQYSKRMSFYCNKPYDYSNLPKASARHYFMMGITFILAGLIGLAVYLYSLRDGIWFAPGIIGLVVVFGIGVLNILAGVKSRKMYNGK
jgi:hypothetical protein